MAKKCYDFTTHSPSPSTLKNIQTIKPKTLTNKELIRKFGQLKAVKMDYVRGTLSNKYYRRVIDPGGVTGKVPKDVFLFTNLDPTIKDFKTEIKKRNLCYSLIIG